MRRGTRGSENVSLTADGGTVDVAGTIDVSGVVGGDVDLFGIDGVTLESGSLIDAHAEGYADKDTRQSHGGVVQIGTDGTGVITVADGAVIDVSARRTGDRLIPTVHNGATYETYVPADLGGVVSYATELKVSLLGVPEELVAEHGVVSAECAEAMATGVRGLTGATWALSTTGVAGPTEQEGKPVGTVYVGIAGPGCVEAIELSLDGDRPTIQAQTCEQALAALESLVNDQVRRESRSLG